MKGIVLDFDGVIAKSMELHAEAYRRALAPFEIPVAERDIFIWEGARSETIIGDLLKQNGRDFTPEKIQELADRKQKIFMTLGEVTLYPGAEDMIRALFLPGVRLGLVTGTRRENLDRLIPRLLPRFHGVLAQDSYSKDKPDPEPYLKAAEAIGVTPEDCAALENAARGVQSARAAGYDLVMGITTTLRKQVLTTAGADVVVADHASAAETLTAWARDGRQRSRSTAAVQDPSV